MISGISIFEKWIHGNANPAVWRATSQSFENHKDDRAGLFVASGLNESFMVADTREKNRKIYCGGFAMERMKRLFLALLITGIAFTLRICTGIRVQSRPEPQVVAKEKTAQREAMSFATALIQSPTIEPSLISPAKVIEKTTDDSPEPGRESGSVTPVTIESGQEEKNDAAEEEKGIRIIQIASAEDTEILIPSDSFGEAVSSARGFLLAGNGKETPCCLMVRTGDGSGSEFIQYLPWNRDDPNAFRLHSPLVGYASVAVYESQKLVGRFYITDFMDEKMIRLNLDLCRSSQLAQL
jgi:hypothetical protein